MITCSASQHSISVQARRSARHGRKALRLLSVVSAMFRCVEYENPRNQLWPNVMFDWTHTAHAMRTGLHPSPPERSTPAASLRMLRECSVASISLFSAGKSVFSTR